MEEFNPLGVSLVSEYTFCQRSFAYRLIDFKPFEEQNQFVLEGRHDHLRLNLKKLSRNREGVEEMREYYVCSTTLGLSGKIDRIQFQDRVKIIEEKRGKLRKNNPQNDIQAQLYALLLSEVVDKPIDIAIYYAGSRRFRQVEWTDAIRSDLIILIESIQTKVNKFNLKNFPKSKDQRCSGCMYQNICGVL